ELLKLLFQALDHTNRFVRETGYQVFASLVRLGVGKDAQSSSALSPEQEIENRQSILNYGDQLADYLRKGLADNWSQVRLAASWATRSFLVTLGDNEAKEQFYPKLLPPMCLNRYYVAAGVRIYSQENWKIITGNDGKRLVEKFIKETVEFYVSQTKADNHAVREAACECIAELGIKVSPDAVRPHVGVLLEAMIECFKDEGWPVRDAACLACGNFVQCFPEECRASLDTLYELFFNNLCDNIPSVRQGAATSLANVVKTYGSEAVEFVTEKAKEKLKAVEKQENADDRFSGLEKGAGLFGVIKRQRDNDIELHSNQTMYSCGSLAPKMGRGGCSNSHFKRPSQPWEITDGCIYLVAELSKLQTTQEQMKFLIPLMAETTKHRHYSQYLQLYESLCKQLPVVAKGLGKRNFKTYIEAFMDPIFHSLTSENALTSTAAVECVQELAKFIGPSILRGRVELYNPSYLAILDNHLHH
ncbi:Leishmanolysin-like peptidase, partial [Paramuricea clavata]